MDNSNTNTEKFVWAAKNILPSVCAVRASINNILL